jgi:hypothetical protein
MVMISKKGVVPNEVALEYFGMLKSVASAQWAAEIDTIDLAVLEEFWGSSEEEERRDAISKAMVVAPESMCVRLAKQPTIQAALLEMGQPAFYARRLREVLKK